jgi:TRAP-type C4-dicarboxylate transport system permease large subunit
MEGVALGKMLHAGYLPGIVSIIVFITGIYIRVRVNPKLVPPRPTEKITWKQRFIALKGIWAIVVLFGVLAGGIYSGYFTATEAAGMSATLHPMAIVGKFGTGGEGICGYRVGSMTFCCS